MRKLLLLPLCSAVCCFSAAFSLDTSGTNETMTISKSSLTNIIALTQKLQTINLQLSSEISNLKISSLGLTEQLTNSEALISDYRAALDESSSNIAILSNQLQQSQTTLAELTALQAKAEQSLATLQSSFNSYKEAADQKIKDLELQRNIGWIIGIGGVVLGALLGIFL